MASNARHDRPRPRAPARVARREVRRAGALLAAAALFLCLAQRPSNAQDPAADRDYVLPLVNQVLETERTDVEVPWRNPETGNSGTIVVRRTFYLEPGKPCREYRRTVERPGAPVVVVEGTGCRIGLEQWRLEEDEPAQVHTEGPGAPSPGGAAAAAPDPAASGPSAPAGCRPAEAAAEPSAPQPPVFADFTMPGKARL